MTAEPYQLHEVETQFFVNTSRNVNSSINSTASADGL